MPLRPSTQHVAGRVARRAVGLPGQWLGWNQFRALGAAALDLCAVASGVVDAYIDCSWDAHGPWDYLGGMLVCTEAGGVRGRRARSAPWSCSNTTLAARPIAAGTPTLAREAVADARRSVAPLTALP